MSFRSEMGKMHIFGVKMHIFCIFYINDTSYTENVHFLIYEVILAFISPSGKRRLQTGG